MECHPLDATTGTAQVKKSGFKSRGKPLSAKKPMNRTSKKRRDYRSSDEGRAGTAYMLAVKQLPCCVCGAPGPSDAHHVIHDRFSARKASDFDTVPLCKRHHQDGPDAIHNGKESWRAKYGRDYDYIEETREKVRDL